MNLGDISPEELRWEMYKGIYHSNQAQVIAGIATMKAAYTAQTQGVIRNCQSDIKAKYDSRSQNPNPHFKQHNPNQHPNQNQFPKNKKNKQQGGGGFQKKNKNKGGGGGGFNNHQNHGGGGGGMDTSNF